MKNDLAKWYEKAGLDFLDKIGIKIGHSVLDFGCGRGHYTIPASKLVGNIGIVYAMDKSKDALNELEKEITKRNIKNVELINDINDNYLKDNSVDVALCYDVLHYMEVKDRKSVYKNIRRILRKNALFSVYPKHCAENAPWGELADVGVDEFIKEVQDSGFTLFQKIESKLLHDNYFEEGFILNFKKEK